MLEASQPTGNQQSANPMGFSPPTPQVFGPDLLDPGRCRAWLSQRLHPAGPACPYCRLPVLEAQRARYLDWGRLRCPACGRWHRATTGTPLAGSKLSAPQAVLLIVLLDLVVHPGRVAELVGVSAETVRDWRGRVLPEMTR